MVVVVFGNVVLRYVFNEGIVWSEELARFMFIWLIFLGAIGALKDNEHLGVDMLVKNLPPYLKRAAYLLSNIIILYVLWLVMLGSWKMTMGNLDTHAPTTGLPLAFVYGSAFVMSIGMAIIILYNSYIAIFEKYALDRLTLKKESEEEVMLVETEVSSSPTVSRAVVHGGGRV